MRKTITMSTKDFIKEHKHLISLLRNPVPAELEAEAKRQEAEFKDYGLELDDKEEDDKEDEEEEGEEDENESSLAKMPLDKLKQTIQQKSQD